MPWEPQGRPLRHQSPLKRAPKVAQGTQKEGKGNDRVHYENVKKHTIKPTKLKGWGAQDRPWVGQVGQKLRRLGHLGFRWVTFGEQPVSEGDENDSRAAGPQ